MIKIQKDSLVYLLMKSQYFDVRSDFYVYLIKMLACLLSLVFVSCGINVKEFLQLLIPDPLIGFFFKIIVSIMMFCVPVSLLMPKIFYTNPTNATGFSFIPYSFMVDNSFIHKSFLVHLMNRSMWIVSNLLMTVMYIYLFYILTFSIIAIVIIILFNSYYIEIEPILYISPSNLIGYLLTVYISCLCFPKSKMTKTLSYPMIKLINGLVILIKFIKSIIPKKIGKRFNKIFNLVNYPNNNRISHIIGVLFSTFIMMVSSYIFYLCYTDISHSLISKPLSQNMQNYTCMISIFCGVYMLSITIFLFKALINNGKIRKIMFAIWFTFCNSIFWAYIYCINEITKIGKNVDITKMPMYNPSFDNYDLYMENLIIGYVSFYAVIISGHLITVLIIYLDSKYSIPVAAYIKEKIPDVKVQEKTATDILKSIREEADKDKKN